MATDNKDPNRGKPRRTYVFAYGKADKLRPRFHSEVFQPDGNRIPRRCYRTRDR